MKKMLLVTAVLLVSSMAFASAPVHFNFLFDGFCDGMTTIRYSPGAGYPKKFLAGTHDIATDCGGAFNSNVGGFQHGNPAAIPPNVAPVNDYSDPIEGLYGLNYSLQYLVHEPTPAKPACVWANYFSFGTANYLLFTGTCTKVTGAAAAKRNAGKPSTVKR